jgi:type 1 glutamine amidotransferase/nicotinamidase-related amidase
MSLPRFLVVLLCVSTVHVALAGPEFEMNLRKRVPSAEGEANTKTVFIQEHWDPAKTAVIVCDMWDAHHCLNAVRRGTEMAERMNQVLHFARDHGATIIHAPSSCMEFYKDHPARKRAQAVPRADNVPAGIEKWLNWIDPREEQAGYPIDASDGGEDDDLDEHKKWAAELTARGRNPGAPWIRQMEALDIEPTDYITDDGVENWNILAAQGIENVILVGVHTNMCVLGRPFGLRQMAKNGKNVVLMRDLTDTMYNPKMPPRVSHYRGTDLIIDHVETFVCPTVTSDQLLGGKPYRFSGDERKHLVMIIGEQEYETKDTLPKFAQEHLLDQFKVTYVNADETDIHNFPGIAAVRGADVVLVSVRRRTPPTAQLDELRRYIQNGGPVVGIRTASHAFSLRDGAPPEGHAVWPEFDKQVFGGNYTGHHGNKADDEEQTFVWNVAAAKDHPILQGVAGEERRSTSHLYKTSPLAAGTTILMMGRVADRQPHEPVSWTYEHIGGGRAFYSSLGNPDDFADPQFQRLLVNAIRWAAGDSTQEVLAKTNNAAGAE